MVWPSPKSCALKSPEAAVFWIAAGRAVLTVTPRFVNNDAATVEKRFKDVTSTCGGTIAQLQRMFRLRTLIGKLGFESRQKAVSSEEVIL